MDTILVKCIFQNRFPYVVGTHWNCLIEAIPMCTYNICSFNKRVFFTIKQVFHKLLNYFFMLQCNAYLEMNKFLCISCS